MSDNTKDFNMYYGYKLDEALYLLRKKMNANISIGFIRNGCVGNGLHENQEEYRDVLERKTLELIADLECGFDSSLEDVQPRFNGDTWRVKVVRGSHCKKREHLMRHGSFVDASVQNAMAEQLGRIRR